MLLEVARQAERLNIVQCGRVFDGGGELVGLVVKDVAHDTSQYLTTARLGHPRDEDGTFDTSESTDLGADPVVDVVDDFLTLLVVHDVAVGAVAQDDQGDGHLALELVVNTDDGTLDNFLVLADRLL